MAAGAHFERITAQSWCHTGLVHPVQVVALARDLLAGLQRSAADSFTVIFGDAAAATAAEGGRGLSNAVVAVDPAAGSRLAGPLLIVGATQQQVMVLSQFQLSSAVCTCSQPWRLDMLVSRRHSSPQLLHYPQHAH